MTIWGIGRRFTLLSLVTFALALVAHIVWYPVFAIEGIPYAVFIVASLALIVVGLPIWITAAKAVDRAFEERYLATQGVYALCRHPIYGNAIFFTIPGVLLLFRSWLLLTVPVLMYVLFRVLVREEEAYLRRTFGAAHEAYASRVNLAFPRLWKLREAFFYPVPTGRVAANVYGVRERDVNAFIYTDGEQAIAIDAAYSSAALRKALEHLGIDPGAVTHVFLTHADVDHVGGLDAFPNADVHMSRDEEQMVDGTRARLFGCYRSPRLQRSHTLLDDGDGLSAGRITVRALAAPGHTPGSMAYLVDDCVLFTGDALKLQDGRVNTFHRLFNMDTPTQREAIAKLAALEGVHLLCTAHTGCTTDYDQAMGRWRRQEQATERRIDDEGDV